MKQVAVQFSSVMELIDFVHETSSPICQVNEEDRTLTSELSETALDHALNDYGATVVNEE